jgi:outer membrane protein OmpA-like peptidoglycan-associated protein
MALALCLIGLAACSAVPDWANPVEWYDSVTGGDSPSGADQPQARRITGPTEAGSGARAATPASTTTPNLATVPDRPQATPAPERRRIESGLAADLERSRYSDEQLRGRPAAPPPNAPPPAITAPQPAVTAPAPPPAPQPAVTAQAVAPAPPAAPPSAPAAPPRPPVAAAPAPAPAANQTLLQQTYERALRASGPTVTTAPAVPTAAPPRPAAPGAAPAAPQAAPAPAPAPVLTPPRAAAPAVAPAVPRPVLPGRARELATVYFAGGAAKLDAKGQAELKRVAATARSEGGTLRVIGHASSGTREKDPARQKLVNFSVSHQRAEAVARELYRLGVDPARVIVEAMGDARPEVAAGQPGAEKGNRRVEIFIEN